MSGKPHPTACARRMCASPVWFPDRTNAKLPCVGSSAILESFVACECSVAEETRTRGFASPALAGFALVDGAFLTELLIRHRQRRGKRPTTPSRRRAPLSPPPSPPRLPPCPRPPPAPPP